MNDRKLTQHINMRVSLIQVDGKIPNLALMKISSYRRKQGHIVGLNLNNPDEVWISCIFTWNRDHAWEIAHQYKGQAIVRIGGSGISLRTKLKDEIEHIMPDYELYGIDYSIGFTSRGCIRRCPFCIVPRKEGRIREHSPFSEFVHPDHKKILLLDNNFLASPNRINKLNYLISHGYRVSFNQGLDIRLVNERLAGLLADVKSQDLRFRFKRYYFAWDLMSYSEHVFRGICKLLEAGIKPRYLMFYILVGFNTTFEEDLYRVYKLIQIGCEPFIMKYNNINEKKLNALARWVNRRYFKVVDWQDFKWNKWRDVYDVEEILKTYDKKYNPPW